MRSCLRPVFPRTELLDAIQHVKVFDALNSTFNVNVCFEYCSAVNNLFPGELCQPLGKKAGKFTVTPGGKMS